MLEMESLGASYMPEIWYYRIHTRDEVAEYAGDGVTERKSPSTLEMELLGINTRDEVTE